jgi:hypothetical protein
MKSTKVDPQQHFADWHYDIRPELWIALGVARREYIDKEATSKLRKAAIDNGLSKDKTAHIKSMYSAYSVDESPQYAFQEGDIFHAKRTGQSLQIGKTREMTEVWVLQRQRYTHACQITIKELAAWLQTGLEPANRRIDKSQSYSEIAKYYVIPGRDC